MRRARFGQIWWFEDESDEPPSPFADDFGGWLEQWAEELQGGVF